MQHQIESLGALERRVQLTVPAAELEREVNARLSKLARTVRMPGFRPGKVPMKVVAANYGAQVQAEVLSDKVGAAFNAAINESKLRVAGQPRVEPQAAEGSDLAFAATFEVFPEVEIGDVAGIGVERAVCPVGDAEVEKTIDIMRGQRATYEVVARAAQNGDRVTVDFKGSIDGTPFDGGTATDFVFPLGAGQMLPEFDAAVAGMKAGESKNFPLTFPAEYRARELAGKQASFEVTLKKVEVPVLPAVDTEFARALGVADGDVEKMRAEIRANLEREVTTRLRSRTRDSVMNALLSVAKFDVPKALLTAEQEQLAARMQQELKGRGAKDTTLPAELFAPQAERRVRLGLLLAELVRRENLSARQDQVRKAIEEIAQSYERPAEVIQWYLGNRERVGELEGVVTEDNVVAWVLSKAQTKDVPVPFDELMGHGK